MNLELTDKTAFVTGVTIDVNRGPRSTVTFRTQAVY